MKNALKHNCSKFILIGKIKGLATEVKRARTTLNKVEKKEAQINLMHRKNILADDIRHHLLAYAFLEGRSYKSVERTHGKFNAPRPEFIFNIIKPHAPTYTNYDGFSMYEPTLEKVNSWLAEGTMA